MMLARVADSLYWIGRHLERAEHISRISTVMLNATLDRADLAAQAAQLALAALGDAEPERAVLPVDSARALVLDRENDGSTSSICGSPTPKPSVRSTSTPPASCTA